MKRVTSFLLAIVLLAGFVMVGSPAVSAASAMTVSDAMIAMLKQEEGFSSKPYWDYAQYTVGYGTKCPDDMVDYYTENGITEEEAELMLRNYLSNTENIINKHFIDIENSNKTEIGMELDIYIPSIKTAIEYDGINWHRNTSKLEIKKNNLCREKNINLINKLKLYRLLK